ncbi:MAG: SIS domain-containing protein [Limimaricola sp.]|uniref:SIS domain-containing protein n=1 Tax=Limimaricola sp. TaxID=2211665 RepID=UPI001DBEEA95|nr:SIS domain-containing protein [Limimaricola sp.]MBI1416580.1 SIS domain-containing protein [Limimaricola sp.]
MRAEIAEAPAVFARAAAGGAPGAAALLAGRRAIYTIARGSSDAAANILSYEFMRELGWPMTSLPPSIFSVGGGVDLQGAAVLAISQSGASADLVRSVEGARARGAAALAITNAPGSAVEAAADMTLPIGAGPEVAVPATKTVIGSVGAGLALLGEIVPGYAARAAAAADSMAALAGRSHPRRDALRAALLRAQHVYVIGRDTGYGAAHELALKLKETCALHAEAYSASEVLHGPLQLATKALTVLILDTGLPAIRDSLDTAEARLRAAGGTVLRISPADVGAGALTPAAAAAALLYLAYPVVLDTALALGHDPDSPATLSKVTQTT